ncbi:pentapeptide repeat-containing protein [Phyllobacterium leguminum]|uniref:Pentapeptide repeat protein n=1 Tax=Phyllobacterium leguminum TaxID=314237 RepID=A0A318TDD7_9HYPH|nr:pentapeptide repeat-containing protein [Phyllobacterium leguminum]PYE86338.1 pentapeptide repeat protein [Phyllobacterium leguminum]
MKLVFTIAALVGLFMSLSAIPATSASFNCAMADAHDERAICATPNLSLADEKLANLYTSLGKGMEGKKRGELAVTQHEWLQQRALCKDDSACLVSAYDRRTKQLQSVAAAPQSVEIDPQSVGAVPKLTGLNLFRTTGQCKGCNLSRADLSGIEPAAHADGGKLGCAVSAVANGVFDGARIDHANFVSCDTKYQSALGSMSWDGASLKGTDFTGTNLGGNKFRDANLTGANLSGATLFWVDMSNATLRRANLTGAESEPDAMNGICSDFSDADFSDAKVEKANLCGSFYNANLTGADLRSATLSGNVAGLSKQAAEVSGIDIDSAATKPSPGRFRGKINLTGADLRGATLFTETKLTPTGYGFAILCRTKMPDGKISNRDCKRK